MQAKRDTYQIITDAIIDALENCAPWERPWTGGLSLTMPVNAVSGHEYRGTNVLMLWGSAKQSGYAENRWATFKQWSEKGARVRKGEKGTPIIFFKMLDRKNADADATAADGDDARIPCARVSWVFNVAQIEGYVAEPTAQPERNDVAIVERADHLVASTKAVIRHEGNKAYYRPSTDQIVMPPKNLFTGTSTSSATESYYGVLLHELTHWTAPRLEREFGKRFGDNAYAAEELVAELGASFLCAKLGIEAEPRADHANYVASWLKILKGDRKALVTAASRAADAADYLMGLEV